MIDGEFWHSVAIRCAIGVDMLVLHLVIASAAVDIRALKWWWRRQEQGRKLKRKSAGKNASVSAWVRKLHYILLALVRSNKKETHVLPFIKMIRGG